MMKVRRGVYALLLPGLLALSPSVFAQWPQFRGPNGSGVEAGSGYPVAFTPSTNVAWKASVPYGQSSPIVVGDRVYLTASDRGRLLTIALDAATGREVWRQGIQPARTTPIYKANDPASPTPAADAAGRRQAVGLDMGYRGVARLRRAGVIRK